MGQKIIPTGLRVGVNENWRSQWVTRKSDFPKLMHEDHCIRQILLRKLANAGIARIEIKRQKNLIDILIYSSRIGVILGQQGKNIEKWVKLIKKTVKNREYKIKIDAIEERNPGLNAQILADEIAYKISNRENYRTVQQEALKNAQRLGVKGIKIILGGRLRGADIARDSILTYGKLPLSTLHAHLDYGFAVSKTTYGQIGVKVWIYKGEKKGWL